MIESTHNHDGSLRPVGPPIWGRCPDATARLDAAKAEGVAVRRARMMDDSGDFKRRERNAGVENERA